MNEIRELLVVVGLELNANRLQRVGKNRTRDIARGPLVNRLMGRHVLNFSDIPCFDGISYKEDFIGWILNFEDYFTYAKIPEDFKVLLVSRKLVRDAADWWNDIEYCRMRRGKFQIFSWARMKRLMASFIQVIVMDNQNYLKGNVARISISVDGDKIKIWVSLMLRKF